MAASRSVPVAELLVGELAKEEHFLALPSYVDRVQRDGMAEEWRSEMGGWYFEVAETYDYSLHTVATATSLLDRYLSVRSVSKNQFMVLTVAAIFAAAKLHESKPAPASELCHLGRFTVADILRAEATLLAGVAWRVHCPTVYSMLHLMLQLLPESGRSAVVPVAMSNYAMFFAEISVHEAGFAELRPSAVALACILLGAEKMRKQMDFTETLMDELCALRPDGKHPLNDEVRESMTRLTSRGVDYADDDYDNEVATLSGYLSSDTLEVDCRDDSPVCISAPLGMPASPEEDARKRRVACSDFEPEKRKCRAHGELF